MAKFPGMVVPSKIKQNSWTFTFREGTLEDHVVKTAESIDSNHIYDRAAIAKTEMRRFCGLNVNFIGNKHGLPR